MTEPLSVHNLLALRDLTPPNVKEYFELTVVKMSPAVHQTFFADGLGEGFDLAGVDPSWLDSVATALVCGSIGRSPLYGFSKTINRQAVKEYLQRELNGPKAIAASRALHDYMFLIWCRGGGRDFGDYSQGDSKRWAALLADRVTKRSFINTTIAKFMAGGETDWLAKLNLIFHKLYRLDPNQNKRVVEIWKKAYPDAIENWQTQNHLAASLFQEDLYLTEVNAAIGTKFIPDVVGDNYDRYGVAVADWLKGLPTTLGLTTGAEPDNAVRFNNPGDIISINKV